MTISDDGFDFQIDWQRLQDNLNDNTRLVIVNFPHNPTGAILGAHDLHQLAETMHDSPAYLLSDEVYEHIVFDGEPHRSLLSHEELWEKCLVISSFGKTFHATGWKVGFCTAPADLSAEFRKVHQFTTFAVNTPVQHAMGDFLQSNPEFYEQLPDFYRQLRDYFCQLLESSNFRLKPARSTFFQILDYGNISDETDVELAKRWTREIGVASIPLSVFCEEPFTGTRLRFCFAKDKETLADAAQRLSVL